MPEVASTSIRKEAEALGLAQYLKEFVGLRTAPVRDISKFEAVLWFQDLPHERECSSPAWIDGFEPGDPWLEVRKQQFPRAPIPPEIILPWIDREALRIAAPDMLPLRQSILQPDRDAELDEGEDPPLTERFLDDHPRVVSAYEEYRSKWAAWSTEYLRREAIHAVYAELFNMHTQVRKQGEIFELVLGFGLLEWRAPPNGASTPIRRHLVTARVDLNFDPANGVIRIEGAADGADLRIEDDMMEAELRPDRNEYAILNERLSAIGDDVWDEASMHLALRSWATVLHADSQWSPGLAPQSDSQGRPIVSFAPALILRKRSEVGMVRIYDELVKRLSGDTEDVPDGRLSLVDDDIDSGSENKWKQDEQVGNATNRVPDEIYFPLPANREQRRIVVALQNHRGVLVQGPPGTGKSHTIANLVCHLLASGKRVLITAETGRALQVLKNKLPPEIQPLCVSLLGQGGDAFAELNTAVQGITTRQAAYSPGAAGDRIIEVDRDLDAARRVLAETDSEIRSLREKETYPHSLL